MSEIAAVVLAAGSSSRMGQPKQLLDFGGKPLVRHAAEVALAAGCSPVLVVLGAIGTEIREALKGLPVLFVSNREWATGMGSSIQAGLKTLAGYAVDAAILCLVDQPFVTPGHLQKLIEIHRAGGAEIVASRYEGTVGVPVLFACSAFPLLEALQAAEGCKGVILRNRDIAVEVDCPEAGVDIDTLEDYRSALQRTGKEN